MIRNILTPDKEHTNTNREHHSVDTLVHEFCKLFGHCGVPEYACGVLSFPDFLSLMVADQSLDPISPVVLLSLIVKSEVDTL